LASAAGKPKVARGSERHGSAGFVAAVPPVGQSSLPNPVGGNPRGLGPLSPPPPGSSASPQQLAQPELLAAVLSRMGRCMGLLGKMQQCIERHNFIVNARAQELERSSVLDSDLDDSSDESYRGQEIRGTTSCTL